LFNFPLLIFKLAIKNADSCLEFFEFILIELNFGHGTHFSELFLPFGGDLSNLGFEFFLTVLGLLDVERRHSWVNAL